MATTSQLVIRRRAPRATPLRRLRLGTASHRSGSVRFPFPGIGFPDPHPARVERLACAALAFTLHAAALAALLAVASLAPRHEAKEHVVPVQLLKEIAAPRTARPAPAPKALAERRLPRFAAAAQAVAPEVVNPTVVARAAPTVAADTLHLGAADAPAAPRRLSRPQVQVQTVQAVTPISAAEPARIDAANAAAPALRGPIQTKAPAAPSVGPRRLEIATDPASVGTGDAVSNAAGSPVPDGVSASRDILGTEGAAPLPTVNTHVGPGYLQGSGGDGTGAAAVSVEACMKRPEVQVYWNALRKRVYSRWVLPSKPASQIRQVRLRFRLDADGSATEVELIPGGNAALGRSAVEAFRAASPFPPMPERARCLAGVGIIGTFSTTPAEPGTARVAD